MPLVDVCFVLLGMHRGGQQWLPPGSCPPNYPPHYGGQVMSEQYRLGSSMPPYGPSMGPCISPHSRADPCGIPIQVGASRDYSLLMMIKIICRYSSTIGII